MHDNTEESARAFASAFFSGSSKTPAPVETQQPEASLHVPSEGKSPDVQRDSRQDSLDFTKALFERD